MSELITTRTRAGIRQQLLSTVSALTLLVAVSTNAKAEDSDRPTVWIELGGQLAHVDDAAQQFAPPFIVKTPRPAAEKVSPLSVGHPPRYSFGGEGKISFEPEETNWIFSAAVRFGRSNTKKHLHQQSYPTHPLVPPISSNAGVGFQYALPFSDVDRKESESHVILDFQAGKDVGLGIFGRNSTSVLSIGVRFAQFNSRSTVAFKSQPDFKLSYKYLFGQYFPSYVHFHDNAAAATAARSFHGVGPSLAWNASIPVAGSIDDGEVTFDWGANAAVLFGRQKAAVHHQTTALYKSVKYRYYSRNAAMTVYRHTPPDKLRSHSVVVPNVGGFAGLSMRYGSAKVSFGYRADFFFGAMDGGIDVRKSYDRNFYGPYATLSIGLGG